MATIAPVFSGFFGHRYTGSMLFALRFPSANERGILHMQQALAAMHQQAVPLTLEYVSHKGELLLCCAVPHRFGSWVQEQLLAQYPDVTLERLPTTVTVNQPNLSPRKLRRLSVVSP